MSGVDAYTSWSCWLGWKEGRRPRTPSNVIASTSLSGFLAPTVAAIVARSLARRRGIERRPRVGRVHLYEGHSADQVVHPVRTLIAAGASRVVLTNACGGLDPTIGRQRGRHSRSPQPHRDLALGRPCAPDGYGSRFVDLTDLYSARLRAVVHGAAGSVRGCLHGFSRSALRDAGRDRDGAGNGRHARGYVTVLKRSRRAIWEPRCSSLSRVELRRGRDEWTTEPRRSARAGQAAATSLGALLTRYFPFCDLVTARRSRRVDRARSR